jgi:uncharacterized membrane protein
MVAAAGMAILLVLVRELWLADATALGRLAILVPLGAMLYLGLLLVLGRDYLRRTLAELRPLLPVGLRRLAAL